MLNYIIIDALKSLKADIEQYEKQMKGRKGYYRKALQEQCRFTFLKGIDILLLSRPEDVSEEVKDWFLGRPSKKPFTIEKEVLKKLEKRGIISNIIKKIIK